MDPPGTNAASEPVAASSSKSALTIRTPSAQQAAAHDSTEAGGSAAAITVKCSDASLEPVTHHWATVESVTIGEHPAVVWYCPSRDAAFAHVKESEKCQQGQVRIVAKCRRKAQGVYRYITPYTYAALKIQDKKLVEYQQARLQQGYGGDDTLLEKAIMFALRGHPHVIQVVECWHEAQNIYTVMEYVNGELLQRVSHAGAMDESTARQYFLQILDGLQSLHELGYCHRDLSLENVLVSDDGCAKLIDFGAATRLPPLQRVQAAHGGATWADTALPAPIAPFGKTAYMLPEYYHKMPYSGRQFDLWSAAVCLFIMLEGEYLYSAPSAADDKFMLLHSGDFATLYAQRNAVRKQRGRPYLSGAVQDLLSGILHPDPNQRPVSIKSLLRHAWLCPAAPPKALPAAATDEELLAGLDEADDSDVSLDGGKGGAAHGSSGGSGYLDALHEEYAAHRPDTTLGAAASAAAADPGGDEGVFAFDGAAGEVKSRAGARSNKRRTGLRGLFRKKGS